jgi:hypothetical protein
MVCSFKTLKKHTGIRLASVILLVVLFITFSTAFGVRLNARDESKPGHCYNSSKISHGSAKHPYHDHLYLGFTVWAVIGVLIWACGGCFDRDAQPTDPITVFFYRYAKVLPGNTNELTAARIVLTYASIQLPLHLYIVIALRATNQSLLEGDSENAWGFGQVISMVMVAATLSECWKGYRGS